MRYVLVFWALPLGIFWGWYFLSFYDINFGTLFFSRMVHDFAFEFYAAFLNTYLGTAITADAIPGMVAEASVIDTLLIMGILAFRRRKKIFEWWQNRKEFSGEAIEAGQEPLEG